MAFGVAFGLGLPLALGACATAPKAYVDEEGGTDDGGASPDGAAGEGGPRDGGGDGSVVGGPRVQCGSTFCRSDQKCVQGACTYECSGTKVPGDYGTITAAVTALAATGSDVTICIGGVQAGESVSISDTAAHNKSLKLIGLTPLQTTLGSVSVGSGFSDVTLQGFGTNSTVTVTGATKVTLRALRMSSASSTALQLRTQSTGVGSTIVVDGCDISSTSTSGYGLYIDGSYTAPFNVFVVNSYIHGGSYGVYVYGSNPQLQLSLVNNTIDRAASYGVYLSAAPTAQVSYVNNIISNHTQYGVYVGTGMTSVAHSHNALFGNTNNYAGTAVDGTGYVKADCMMDMSTGVPQTKPGSPCRGAGIAQGAPPTDYWNAPRGTSVDIGAVQGP